MRLRLIVEGPAFRVFALDLGSGNDPPNCPAEEYLDGLSERDRASMLGTMTMHAKIGPLRNVRRSRLIEASDRIFEFKNTHGDRILYFYAAESRTILACGFTKGAKLSVEVRRAERMRADWERAKGGRNAR